MLEVFLNPTDLTYSIYWYGKEIIPPTPLKDFIFRGLKHPRSDMTLKDLQECYKYFGLKKTEESVVVEKSPIMIKKYCHMDRFELLDFD